MFNDFDEQEDIFSEADSEFNQQGESSADFFNNEQTSEQDIIQSSQTKFGYKTVGIIVSAVLVILALIILFFSKLRVVDKSDSNPQLQSQIGTQVQGTQSQGTQVQGTQSQSQRQETTNSYSQQASANNNYTSLINIPTSTKMDYSGNIIQSQGVVSSLSKYLQDGQVIYCVNLDIVMGTSKTVVHYYCGYNVFSQLSVGDVVNVDYQQVSDTCFSVCTISK